MHRILAHAIIFTICAANYAGVLLAADRSSAPRLAIEVVTKKREFKTVESQVIEFRAIVSASSDSPLKIRAWNRFFADYEVIQDFHGSIDVSQLRQALRKEGRPVHDDNAIVEK